MGDLITRPEFDYYSIADIDPDRPELPVEVCEQAEIELKYEGYISKQLLQIEAFKKTESKMIPENLDYDDVPSLRIEARQKLKAIRPLSIGQASRISGVSPADISVLLDYMSRFGSVNN